MRNLACFALCAAALFVAAGCFGLWLAHEALRAVLV